MFLKFEICDNKGQLIGNTAVTLDWNTHKWSVTDDKAGAWKRVANKKLGKFDAKEWGVIWMWDESKNIVIVHDSPKSSADTNALSGTFRLYDPADSTLKDSVAKWTLDVGPAGKVSMVMHKPLPFTRNAYIQRLNMLFPATYKSLNNDLLTNKLRKEDKAVVNSPGKYTSCGSLPGFITQQVALSKGLKGPKYDEWVKKNSLNGTNRVRDMGLKLGCWVESAPEKKPKPGDIYALLDRGTSDKKVSGISHVGVFECEIGNKWSTFDLGQSGGFDGSKNLRDYKSATCELWGETNQGGGYRVVAGWVDLERYFNA
jgi:hypothetical protein